MAKATFGEYVEIDLIGKGSYGKVYTVKSKSDGEVYVLKKVAFDGTPQSEADAALREAHVLSVLRHPHIVPYKEFFKSDDGDLCLVMAYCEGGDLFKIIRQHKKAGNTMDELVSWQYLVQMLLSLSYCHSKKILHRDVKTQNIFISQGKVLLGDFGLAKQLQRTLEMARTPIGTPYYMAPEIYEEQPYSFKSDVWALGCVMYEMLTGRPAFGAETLSKVVLRVIRGNFDPLPEHYSEALRSVVGAMLCKTVKKRPDVNELLTHPHVTPHVQAYLDSLSQEGAGGWSTWRMKLPPSFLASLALIMENSQKKVGQADGQKGGQSAGSVQAPPTPSASGKAVSSANPAAPDFAEALVLQHQVDTIGQEVAAGRHSRSSSSKHHHHHHHHHASASGSSLESAAARPATAGQTSALGKGQADEQARSFRFNDLTAVQAPGTPPAVRLKNSGAGGEGDDGGGGVASHDDDETLSLGHISLYESLGQRVGLLRKELAGVLGNERLGQAMAAIAKEHADGLTHSEDEEAALHRRVSAMMGQKWTDDLWPLLVELQFLDAHSGKASK